MLIVDIDKVAFRCTIDKEAEMIDTVLLNGVEVDPADWFNGFVLRQLDDAVREYLADYRSGAYAPNNEGDY